jgi:acyl-CoA synthetase (AMP-forming)/AMP-acid ligase II
MSNQNLFVALRDAFPADLDRTAVETDDGLRYSWRDLDRATAMLANLLDSLDLPPASRIAVQVEKSVEAMVLYLATLRAGHVFLPLNTAYQSAEIEYFIGNAEPAVVVCSPKNLAGSARSRSARARNTSSPWAMTAPAACWSAPRTTATATHPPCAKTTNSPPSSTPAAPPAAARAPC